jgi:NAD+ kinase
MKIAVYGRQFNEAALPFIQQVFDSLSQHSVEIYVHHQLNNYLARQNNTGAYNVLEMMATDKRRY